MSQSSNDLKPLMLVGAATIKPMSRFYPMGRAHSKAVKFMWQCPKCGRKFKNTNQDHYCGQISTIDEYIAAQPEAVQPLLQQVRKTVRSAAPKAIEKISWRMPTFWQGENLIHFAAFKDHLSIFPGGEAAEAFAERLTGYKTSKGTIQFPLNKPIDFQLIADITRWRVKQAGVKRK